MTVEIIGMAVSVVLSVVGAILAYDAFVKRKLYNLEQKVMLNEKKIEDLNEGVKELKTLVMKKHDQLSSDIGVIATRLAAIEGALSVFRENVVKRLDEIHDIFGSNKNIK